MSNALTQFSCEIASNPDPFRGRRIPLITSVNPIPGWGHGWTRNTSAKIHKFCNVAKVLGNSKGGVIIASDFTLTALVLFLGAAGMLNFERAHEGASGLTSYGHALWWTGMLIASIGTDFWPASPEGRILSSLLSLYGLAVFGYVTATFASFFIGRDAGASEDDVASVSDLTRLHQEIAALRQLLEAQQPPSASGMAKLGPGEIPT